MLKNLLFKELEANNFHKVKIKEIAKKYELKESELKKFYITKFFEEISKDLDL